MRYTKIAEAKPFEGAPKINLCACFGASDNKPIILKIPVTGERPITYGAENLPEGLTLQDGIITGKVAKEGNYEVLLTAENRLGKAEKKLTLEIKRDTVLLSPLLGFTSWNAFGPDVTQEKMERTAHQMTELGITEYGYSYVNLDSGWQYEYGGKYDAIMPNYKFPDMKGMCDKIHALGLKCGMYSTPVLNAWGCPKELKSLPGCTTGEPDILFSDIKGGIGVERKEKNNALQWAEWGFDYLKYDWRPCEPYNAELMRRELVATDRDFGFCVTVRARAEYHSYWEKYCNSYRCNTDSIGNWDNLMGVYDTYAEFIDYINKGHYFDLDMLDVGNCDLYDFCGFFDNGDYGLTEDEQIVSYSIRAFLTSPIQISSNLSKINDFELSLYCNEEVIAINQDEEFAAAKPFFTLEADGKKIHAYRKKLAGGDYAIAVFNLGEKKANVKLYLDEYSAIRDVWAKENLESADSISLETYPHTVRIFRISKNI